MLERLSETLGDFFAYYGRQPSEAELAVEREVFGINAGIISYTTPSQADQLAQALELDTETQLLEIGAGSGWPGVRMVQRSGCKAVLTDVPVSGIRTALMRAEQDDVVHRLSFAVASGTNLPFLPRYFDAVAHSDVL